MGDKQPPTRCLSRARAAGNEWGPLSAPGPALALPVPPPQGTASPCSRPGGGGGGNGPGSQAALPRRQLKGACDPGVRLSLPLPANAPPSVGSVPRHPRRDHSQRGPGRSQALLLPAFPAPERRTRVWELSLSLCPYLCLGVSLALLCARRGTGHTGPCSSRLLRLGRFAQRGPCRWPPSPLHTLLDRGPPPA